MKMKNLNPTPDDVKKWERKRFVARFKEKKIEPTPPVEHVDIDVSGSPGGICSITGITQEGREWIAENVNFENWQVQGGCSVVLESSMVFDIVQAAEDDDLIVDGADDFRYGSDEE